MSLVEICVHGFPHLRGHPAMCVQSCFEFSFFVEQDFVPCYLAIVVDFSVAATWRTFSHWCGDLLGQCVGTLMPVGADAGAPLARVWLAMQPGCDAGFYHGWCANIAHKKYLEARLYRLV